MAVVLLLTMSVSGFCGELTTAEPAGQMEITTSVPSAHTVTVTYTEGGYVLFRGKLCPSGTQIAVDRFGEINLDIICSKGYHIKTIEINGEDVTERFVNGTLKIENVVNDVHVEFSFQSCADDAQDSCKTIDMEGTVYLGKNKLKDAEMKFDFGDVVATDENGRYSIDDIGEGRHFVTISKDGEMLANCQVLIERGQVSDTVITTLPDGTTKVTVPMNADKFYLDFIIEDSNDDGVPDVDPDITDPTTPPEDGFVSPDPDEPPIDDGVDFEVGEPEPEVPGFIPDLGAMLVKYPVISATTMVSSFFLILLILFKRKKEDEEEEEQPIG